MMEFTERFLVVWKKIGMVRIAGTGMVFLKAL